MRALSSPSTVACCAATPMRWRTASGSGRRRRSRRRDAVPSVGADERGEDADRRGLAGAVVAEQPEHRARRDVEVEVAQRPQVAEALAEALGDDAARRRRRAGGRRLSSYAVLTCSYIVRPTLAVHCTTWQPRTSGRTGRRRPRRRRADVRARSWSTRRPRRSPARSSAAGTTKVAGQGGASTPRHARAAGRAPRRARRVDARRARQRAARASRRDEIAAAAIRIADAEGLRRGVDAPHRGRARRRNDDALPLRAHEGRAARRSSSTR